MKKTELIIVIAVSALVSLFYYGPFLDNYFVWDDFMMLENFISGNLKDAFFGFADLRLFGNLILWFNFLVSGFNPVGYSLIGIAAHTANSVMLFLLINSISNDRLLSIFTAIIFAASSVGSDAILWRCAFLTVTGLFFFLLILYLYVEGNKRRNPAFHNLALIIFFFAMFNKEEIASLPFMIIFIEMIFFRDEERLTSKLKRVLPYFVVIVIYILLSYVISRYYVSQEQFERFLSFRPLHTLFSGLASFFISPDGRLHWDNPFIYLIFVFTTCSSMLIKDRKLLLFGLGWCFLTFLPQSLTGLTQYDPPYLFNSISRHLYLPSVSPAIVFSVIILSVKEHLSQKVFVATITTFFMFFIFVNYERVNARGQQWREVGMINKQFLHSLIEIQPYFPKNSYVHIINPPFGRSYTQRSLRAFYRNQKIYWTDDPGKATHLYLYLSGHVIDKHESIMKLLISKGIADIDSVVMFYDLKGLKQQKIEFLRTINASDHKQHLALGRIYATMTLWIEAEREFKEAMSIKSNSIETRYELGLVYLAEKKYDFAMEELEFVAKNDVSNRFSKAKEFIEDIKKQKLKKQR